MLNEEIEDLLKITLEGEFFEIRDRAENIAFELFGN